ncbi:unnamed protein product [Diamesa serratosioi]
MFKELLLVFLFEFGIICTEFTLDPHETTSCTLQCHRGLVLDSELCKCTAPSTTTSVCDLSCSEGSLVDQDNCWCYPDPSFTTLPSSCDLNCPDGMIKDDFNCRCFAQINYNSTVFCEIVCPEDRIRDPQLCLCNELLGDTSKCTEETSIDHQL